MRVKVLRPNPRKLPLMTTAELAAEFGMTTIELVRHLVHKSRPTPALQCGSSHSAAGARSYYFPHEMRAWWKLRKQEIENEQHAKSI